MSAGNPELAVLTDGSLLMWGDFVGTDVPGSRTPRSAQLPSGSRVVHIASSGDNFLAVTDQEVVYGYGTTNVGQLGDGPQVKGFRTAPERIDALSNLPISELCLGGFHGIALIGGHRA
jgi:alpha-tubulin suppressor-like RCC1 family protein